LKLEEIDHGLSEDATVFLDPAVERKFAIFAFPEMLYPDTAGPHTRNCPHKGNLAKVTRNESLL